MTATYSLGSIVEYTTTAGCARTVRVTNRTDDVKHGLPGFDGIEVDSVTLEDLPGPYNGAWGYDEDITWVVRP